MSDNTIRPSGADMLKDVLGLGSQRSAGAERSSASATSGDPRRSPNGPRGYRMLSPDTPVESLDRSAPRGTYLDILV